MKISKSILCACFVFVLFSLIITSATRVCATSNTNSSNNDSHYITSSDDTIRSVREENTHNWLDYLNSLSQAIATLLAVILAFLLSILSERSLWEQRKKEQIREHQLTSLKELVHLMQTVDFVFKQILYKKEITTETAGLLEQENVKYKAANLCDATNKEIKEKLAELETLKIEIEKEYWELKFLKYNEDSLKKVYEYIDEFDRTITTAKRVENPIFDDIINNKLICCLNQLFEQFIQEAESGLTK